MATPSLTPQNYFSTSLSTGITSTDTTIYLASLPTGNEGYLEIDEGSSSKEIIYFTSKGANFVTCPSVGAGRGVGGTSAVAHLSGATVKMKLNAEWWKELQNGNAVANQGLNPYKILGSAEFLYDFVASGCVWSGDSYGSTRAASMTSGVIYIGGKRLTVAAVTARSFTASKDVYVGFNDNGDGTAVPVYYDNTTNAASPSLATAGYTVVNAIIVVGASSIAAVGSVNQGQVGKLLPIASSAPYMVTDSIGNLICNRSPRPRVIGYRQVASVGTPGDTSRTGVCSTPAIIPTGRRIKVNGQLSYGDFSTSQNSSSNISVVEDGTTTVAAGVGWLNGSAAASNSNRPMAIDIYNPAAGLHAYTLSYSLGGSFQMSGGTDARVIIELD